MKLFNRFSRGAVSAVARVRAFNVILTLVLLTLLTGLGTASATATTIFDSITTEVTTDAALVVTFSLIAITVTIAFYLWSLARKSINRAK